MKLLVVGLVLLVVLYVAVCISMVKTIGVILGAQIISEVGKVFIFAATATLYATFVGVATLMTTSGIGG